MRHISQTIKDEGAELWWKKETVKQETKRLIGELFDAENVSCDMNYLMEVLYKQGQITHEQYNQITAVLQQKKE
ncbi:hypothetical protein ACT7C1_24765 [Bacillus paranthracis]